MHILFVCKSHVLRPWRAASPDFDPSNLMKEWTDRQDVHRRNGVESCHSPVSDGPFLSETTPSQYNDALIDVLPKTHQVVQTICPSSWSPPHYALLHLIGLFSHRRRRSFLV
jgi:hypothetical protein